MSACDICGVLRHPLVNIRNNNDTKPISELLYYFFSLILSQIWECGLFCGLVYIPILFYLNSFLIVFWSHICHNTDGHCLPNETHFVFHFCFFVFVFVFLAMQIAPIHLGICSYASILVIVLFHFYRIDLFHAAVGICEDSGASIMAKSLFAQSPRQTLKEAVIFQQQNDDVVIEEGSNFQLHGAHKTFCFHGLHHSNIGPHISQSRMCIYKESFILHFTIFCSQT